MKPFRKKTVTAAVMAAAVIGVLAVPGQAQAADTRVRVQVCNQWRQLFGVSVWDPEIGGVIGMGIPSGNCTAAGGPLKTGQWYDVTLWWTTTSSTRERFWIPADAPAGSVQRVTYRY